MNTLAMKEKNRARARAPFSAITLYLSCAAVDLISRALQRKCAVVKIRIRRIRWCVMAVYYLANYRHFLIRPGACGPRRSPSSGDSAMGPLIVRASRAWAPRRRCNLWDLVYPRRNAYALVRTFRALKMTLTKMMSILQVFFVSLALRYL